MALINKIADVAARIGKGLIESGGEVSRAEDSICRICFSLGMSECNVVALNSFIIIGIEDPDGECVTVCRRIKKRTIDLGRLELLNELSREICDGRINLVSASEVLRQGSGVKASSLTVYAASMAVCAVFTLYFGGGWREAVVSALAAAVTVTMKKRIKNEFGNAVIFTFVCSVSAGICGAIGVLVGMARDYAVIAKGDIMLLVPGLSLICAGRDIICGDFLTGLLEFIETLLIALALAAGFALPELLLNGVG